MPDDTRPLTPVPFTSPEAAGIRAAFGMAGAAGCPRCREVLQVSHSSDGVVRALSCERCRRILFLRRDQSSQPK
jgi:hypothetical protein